MLTNDVTASMMAWKWHCRIRNCLVNRKTLLKRCILAVAWPSNGAKTVFLETCKGLFGAYREFAKQFLRGCLRSSS